MRRGTSRVALIVLGILVCCLAAGGYLFAPRDPNVASSAAPLTPATTPTAALPQGDVVGDDIVGLPRYTESVRVNYRRSVQNGLVTTRAEYLTTANLQTVHDFYRGVFLREGWIEADVRFTQERRAFFVIAGECEADVILSSRGELTTVEIELSMLAVAPTPTSTPSPIATTTPAATATATPLPTPPPPPLPTERPAPPPPPTPTPVPIRPPAPLPPAPPPVDDDSDDDSGDDDGEGDDGDNGGEGGEGGDD